MDQRAIDIEKQEPLCTCCQPERSRANSVHYPQVWHGIPRTQRLGACIIITAIMLRRNTSSTIARPINIALRTGSFCCFWLRKSDAVVKSAGAALVSSGVVFEMGRSGIPADFNRMDRMRQIRRMGSVTIDRQRWCSDSPENLGDVH